MWSTKSCACSKATKNRNDLSSSHSQTYDEEVLFLPLFSFMAPHQLQDFVVQDSGHGIGKPSDRPWKMPEWCFSLSELSILLTVSEDVGLYVVNFPFLNPALYLWLTKKKNTSIKGVCWALDSGKNYHDKSLIPLQNSPIYGCLFISLIVFVFHGYDEMPVKYIDFLLISTHSQGTQSLVSIMQLMNVSTF